MESEHIATRRSPLHKQRRRRRSRSANNDDIDLEEEMEIRQQYTSQSRRRSKRSTSASRKRSMHHHSPSDEGSFVSEMSEQEVHHEHRERKRMRRRNDHQRHQHDTHHSHSSRRNLRQEKPMNEIIISSPSSQQYHLQQQKNQYTNCQLERDVLLAEYGKLYGRQCSIYERKSRLELELRAIQKFMLADSNSSGNSDRLLAGDMSMAGSTNLLLAGGTSTTTLGSGTNTMMLMG